MRRLPILLAFGLVFALFVVAAATAAPPTDWCGPDGTKPDHPSCSDTTTTTTPPIPEPPEVCQFVDGVLQGWEPPASYRCQWTVDDLTKSFDFKLQPVMPDGTPVPEGETDGMTVNLPHLIVTDVYPSGGQICFNEYVVGWNPLPYSWTQFTLPQDGMCTGGGGDFEDEPNVFAITIDAIKVKNAEVQLQYTP